MIEPNTLHCGDCLELMAGVPDGSVDMTLTDIPYNEVSQKSGGLRLLDRGSVDRCTFQLETFIQEIVRVTAGSFYVFCGTQQISLIVTFFKAAGLTTRVGAWEKTNPSPMNGSRLWVSGLEFCVFARKSNAVFNEHCKKALWQNPSGRSKIHPTEKPLKLMERLVLASSNPEQIVFDPCMGSGTTCLAARNLNRRFIGMEMDPVHFATACCRLGISAPSISPPTVPTDTTQQISSVTPFTAPASLP